MVAADIVTAEHPGSKAGENGRLFFPSSEAGATNCDQYGGWWLAVLAVDLGRSATKEL